MPSAAEINEAFKSELAKLSAEDRVRLEERMLQVNQEIERLNLVQSASTEQKELVGSDVHERARRLYLFLSWRRLHDP